MAEIGTRLKVVAVLEGSVRKVGNRLRVTAQLINVSDGYHLWSERYDRDMDDIFAVQDDIARTVVEKLKVKLLGKPDAPMVTRPTENLEAYNLVLQGRYHALRFTGPAAEKALDCFTQALALDPNYAQAHAGVALVQSGRASLGVAAPDIVMPEAKEAALKALTIDETIAEAHTALSDVYNYEWNWAGAERELRRALELNPGDVFARAFYARLLGQLGRADEAITEARSAVERDPLSLNARMILSLVFVIARRFDEAIAEAHAGIELDPTYPRFYLCLGRGLAGLGRYEEAAEAFRQATIVAPGDPTSQADLGCALGLAGHRQEALTMLEELERQEHVGGVLLADVSMGLGDHDQAISWLQQAAEERDVVMLFLNTFPVFDPLRSDPRFQALLRKMNFPPTSAE